jgi:hypothetical protein
MMLAGKTNNLTSIIKELERKPEEKNWKESQKRWMPVCSVDGAGLLI